MGGDVGESACVSGARLAGGRIISDALKLPGWEGPRHTITKKAAKSVSPSPPIHLVVPKSTVSNSQEAIWTDMA